MSLIYNSLKQHEKQAEAAPQGNPISQRIERAQQPALPKFFWFALFGLSFVIFAGAYGFQQYWQMQAQAEPVESNNQLVSATQPEVDEPALKPQKTAELIQVKVEKQQAETVQLAMVQPAAENQPESTPAETLQTKSAPSGSHTSDATSQKEQSSDKPAIAAASEAAQSVPPSESVAKVTAQPKLVKAELIAPQKPVERVVQQPAKANSEQVEPTVTETKVVAQKQPTTVVTKQTPAKTIVNKEQKTSVPASEPAIKVVQAQPKIVKAEPVVQTKPTAKAVAQKPEVKVARLTPKTVPAKSQTIAEEEPKIVVKTVKRIMPQPQKTEVVAQAEEPIKAAPVSKSSVSYLMAVKRKVSEIKQSIKLKDQQATAARLHQLEEMAGSDSVIYQRMNAYSSLKNRKYEDAATSYQKLLNQKPEDLEANMNLVIALSEMGDTATAKQQLSRLDNLYPESNQVRQYKRMIKAKYGY